MNLRAAVFENLKNSSSEDVFKTISDAISSKEEKTLPGLGVIFELFWNSQSNSSKQNLCEQIAQKLNN